MFVDMSEGLRDCHFGMNGWKDWGTFQSSGSNNICGLQITGCML